jgi:hypothetical protein
LAQKRKNQVRTGKNTKLNKQLAAMFWLNWRKYGSLWYSLSCAHINSLLFEIKCQHIWAMNNVTHQYNFLLKIKFYGNFMLSYSKTFWIRGSPKFFFYDLWSALAAMLLPLQSAAILRNTIL